MMRGYLRERRRLLSGIALCYVTLAVSFLLFRLPLLAVCYPLLLTLLVGGVLLLLDFRRSKRRVEDLHRLQTMPSARLPPLPSPESRLEAEYQALLLAMQETLQRQETEVRAQYQERLAYYTVWAHQMKTPIAVMKLFLQEEDSPTTRRLSAELFRVEQYAEMVMTYLRLEDGGSDYVFRDCAIDPLIRQSVRRFSAEFISRKIALVYTPISLRLVTDEKWFAFVLEQLLSNALKYTRTGEIQIFLRKEGELCIRDSGIGIASEDLPRVFEKGYTGYNGRKDKRASGIGLYLCRAICERLGIGIALESELGVGTTAVLSVGQREVGYTD